MKNKHVPEQIPFVNRTGQIIYLPDTATMADLVKMGVRHLGLIPKGTPRRKLKPGQWMSQ